jgi:hypothetical protein
MSPVNRKAARQPNRSARTGTRSGASTAPTFDPALNTPVASARSRRGNHSAVVFTAAGKFPASPSPRKKRATPNPNAELARACPAAASDQATSAMAYPARVPTRSMNRPSTRNPIA